MSWQTIAEIGSLNDVTAEKGESLDERLRRLSRAAGFTSDEDAARAIPVSYRQYQRYLAGVSEPRASTLKQIAEAFGTSLSELVGLPDEDQLDRIEAALSGLVELVEAMRLENAARALEATRLLGAMQPPPEAKAPRRRRA